MTILYRFFIALYHFAIRCSAFFGNAKAKLWVQGRYDLEEKLKALPANEERIWFHCASLGEFEQGRPLIERLNSERGGQKMKSKIFLTFFSPSGYEVRKNYAGADYVFYLPLDGKRRAALFMDCVKPTASFFIKYDYWYFFLRELKQRNIPVYSISSIFRPRQVFFKWYGGFFRKMLQFISHYFVQDKQSGELLQQLGLQNFTVSGDTRFDRVTQVAGESKSFPLIAHFTGSHPVLVAGSTWPEDEKILSHLLDSFPDLRLMVAPHEVSKKRIDELANRFSSSVCLSLAGRESLENSRVLIIDGIGNLSSLYKFGRFAYVGGGFGKGIHNVLEAAVYGLPVFFGPNYHRFIEAVELVQRKGAFPVSSEQEMNAVFGELKNNPQMHSLAAEASLIYVREKTGATEKILSEIKIPGR